jgi:hypothetical protein
MATTRAYTSGAFALELEGISCGFIRSVSGGSVEADVVEEPVGPEGFAKKHIGNVRYEDLDLEIAIPPAAPIAEWIRQLWQRADQRRSGAIVLADAQLEARSRRRFFDAQLVGVTLPACDAGAKEPAYVALKLAAERIRSEPASGKLALGAPATKQKQWLPANFRLSVDGLDCTRVSRIEALTVRRTTPPDPVGEMRDYAREPGTIEFPNLRITVSEAGAESWRAWHEDFVVQGNCADDKERSGTLELLSADRKSVLMAVRFKNLGIFRLEEAAAEAGVDQIARIVCDLYCERMELGPFEAVAPVATVRVARPTIATRPVAPA